MSAGFSRLSTCSGLALPALALALPVLLALAPDLAPGPLLPAASGLLELLLLVADVTFDFNDLNMALGTGRPHRRSPQLPLSANQTGRGCCCPHGALCRAGQPRRALQRALAAGSVAECYRCRAISVRCCVRRAARVSSVRQGFRTHRNFCVCTFYKTLCKCSMLAALLQPTSIKVKTMSAQRQCLTVALSMGPTLA